MQPVLAISSVISQNDLRILYLPFPVILPLLYLHRHCTCPRKAGNLRLNTHVPRTPTVPVFGELFNEALYRMTTISPRNTLHRVTYFNKKEMRSDDLLWKKGRTKNDLKYNFLTEQMFLNDFTYLSHQNIRAVAPTNCPKTSSFDMLPTLPRTPHRPHQSDFSRGVKIWGSAIKHSE